MQTSVAIRLLGVIVVLGVLGTMITSRHHNPHGGMTHQRHHGLRPVGQDRKLSMEATIRESVGKQPLHEVVLELLQEGGDREELADIVLELAEEEHRKRDHCETFDFSQPRASPEPLLAWVRLSKIGGTSLHHAMKKWIRSVSSKPGGSHWDGCDGFSNNAWKWTPEERAEMINKYNGLDVFDYARCLSIAAVYPTAADRDRLQYLAGHQHFGSHLMFPEKRPIMLMVSREIRQMIRSSYQFITRQRNWTMTMAEFAASHGPPNNWVVISMCGPGSDVCNPGDRLSYAVARANLVSVGSVMGLFVDRPAETLEVFAYKLQWDGFLEVDVKHKEMPDGLTYTVARIDAEAERHMVEHNFYDMKLHDLIVEIFEVQLQCARNAKPARTRAV